MNTLFQLACKAIPVDIIALQSYLANSNPGILPIKLDKLVWKMGVKGFLQLPYIHLLPFMVLFLRFLCRGGTYICRSGIWVLWRDMKRNSLDNKVFPKGLEQI